MIVEEKGKRHFFDLGQPAQKIKIVFEGIELASSQRALLLKEVGKHIYDQVYYLPREDVNMQYLTKSEYSTVCPIKGTAASYDFKKGDMLVENIAWSYEEPLPRAKRISGYVAFYSDKVSFVLEPIKE